MSGVFCMAQEDSTFEDTVKNLLKMPHKPHKPAKAEKDDQDDELAAELINRQKTVSTYGAYDGCGLAP